MLNLRKIDDLVLGDHSFLNSTDECFYLMEYTSHAGFNHSEANSIIINFKKSPTLKGTDQYFYKERDIKKVTRYFQNVFPNDNLMGITLVPMPPSKSPNHEEYDDRILQIVQGVCTTFQADVRELLIMTESIPSFHSGLENRLPPNVLSSKMTLVEELCQEVPSHIIIFDDVITSGSHFKAAQQILTSRFPGVPISGVFVARRVFEELDEF